MSTRMSINGEPCELVTDFAQLRPADTVYLLQCTWCGNSPHRGMLMQAVVGPVMDFSRVVQVVPGFPLAPEPHNFAGTRTLIIPNDVRLRAIWRVIDPLKTTGDDMKQGEVDAIRKPERVVVVEQTGPLIPLKKEG